MSRTILGDAATNGPMKPSTRAAITVLSFQRTKKTEKPVEEENMIDQVIFIEHPFVPTSKLDSQFVSELHGAILHEDRTHYLKPLNKFDAMLTVVIKTCTDGGGGVGGYW